MREVHLRSQMRQYICFMQFTTVLKGRSNHLKKYSLLEDIWEAATDILLFWAESLQDHKAEWQQAWMGELKSLSKGQISW